MQTKKHSIIESVFSTAIGFVINVLAQHFIFPFFDIHIAWHSNLLIAVFFTIISIIRSYVIRRIFTHKTERGRIK